MCFTETPHLNGKHVVFGKVSTGFPLLKKIEKLGSESGKTRKNVMIADCGEISKEVVDNIKTVEASLHIPGTPKPTAPKGI